MVEWVYEVVLGIDWYDYQAEEIALRKTYEQAFELVQKLMVEKCEKLGNDFLYPSLPRICTREIEEDAEFGQFWIWAADEYTLSIFQRRLI